MPHNHNPDLSAEILLAAREIAYTAEQMATAAAGELTTEALENLTKHADSLTRALVEFRAGCNEVIKQAKTP